MTKTPNAVDVYVGKRVRARRMQIGMSQEKLGDAIGLTFQQVQKYEKGSNRISASRIVQIGTVLGVGPAYFFDGLSAGGDVDQQQLGAVEFASTPIGAEIIAAWSSLTAAGQDAVIVMVRAISPSRRAAA